MKKLNDAVPLNIASLLILILLVAGCTSGTTPIKRMAPIQPPERLPDNIVLDPNNPDFFELATKQPILSMTQGDVTVSISYWRKADLDFKYNRGSSISPFYEREALHQGDKTDVFYIKIDNKSPQTVLFSVKGRRAISVQERGATLEVVDESKTRYPPLTYYDMQERLKYIPGIGGMLVRNGLKIAKTVLIEKKLPSGEIPAGKSAEGFIQFQQVKVTVAKLEVIIPIEKAPPEGTTARYQNLVYRFPFSHSEAIRYAQPGTIRY